jgi:hypothetical protein
MLYVDIRALEQAGVLVCVYEGIQGFGKCNRTDIFTRCHYWACTEQECGYRYFIHVIIILQPPYSPAPLTSLTPYRNIHAQTHPHL